jgi:tetratricopeptide (TPR) repeat protein
LIPGRTLRLTVFLFTCAIAAHSQGTAAGPGALQLLQAGHADEALQSLHQRLTSNPDDAEAWNLQGRVYFQLKLWDESIHSAEKATRLRPDNSEYHLWLGRAYGEKADSIGSLGAISLVRKVKAEFEKAAALDAGAKDLSTRADLAEFYGEAPGFMGGDKTKARDLGDFVMKRDAALGHLMAANLAREQKKSDLAEQEYKPAIEASRSAAHYWVTLASF